VLRTSAQHCVLHRGVERFSSSSELGGKRWAELPLQALELGRYELDHVLIWNAVDLGRKLEEFRNYYNNNRVHQSLGGGTPGERSGQPPPAHAALDHYAWRHHCHGLFQMPTAE